MNQERIIWAEGIDRSSDPRHIGKNSQYDVCDMEVIERGVLSKRKGFGRWRETDNTFSRMVRGTALMYDSDENRYLFVLYDGIARTNLWVEIDGTVYIVPSFFPSKGYRVRAAVFGDRIYFVNGVDRPRWYKEYDGSNHIWGIAGVPSPARRAEDESDFDYFISRALYADCITSSQDLGIDPPGIWRYKQTVGYYGKVDDEQVEESNAGAASKMFHCQFNMAETLGTTLEGYVKRGIPIGIADFDDLILDANESGGQDYEKEIRWIRLYRQMKMFSDELYSPFEFLVEMKKGWPTSIADVYRRDSAVVAPTTRVSIPVSHHIEKANNRLFLGRIEKELFTQPGLPKDFRGIADTYKPNFSYRWPITIHNTNSKTLTSAIISLRFQRTSATDHVATPPSGGGVWVGAYIDWNVGFATNHDEVMFVDEDGVTPLGYVIVESTGERFTFLVEIPEIAAGGSRTIYLYAEDDALNGEVPQTGEPGHWRSLAHYRLLESSHDFLIDFENWEAGMDVTDITQKRSLGKIEGVLGEVEIMDTLGTKFFGDSGKSISGEKSLKIKNSDVEAGQCEIPFYTSATGLSEFSFVLAVRLHTTSPLMGTIRWSVKLTDDAGTTNSVLVEFRTNDADTMNARARVYDIHGSSYHLDIFTVTYSDGWLYFLVQVEGANFRFACVQNPNTGHPASGASWDSSAFDVRTESRSDIPLPIRFFPTNKFVGRVEFLADPNYSILQLKEVEFVERIVDAETYSSSKMFELLQMSMHDSYWPNNGLATVDDRESQAGEKRPDRMYFSKLNQPNSFEAIDFRDMGELGRPIQGIKGIRNRVFVFDENKIRALFGAGAEQALPLGSGDTRMWNLSQDLTGEIGGLGVLAPDSLVTMEFAGRDGVGFLSRRGFYFFDGNGFVHISEKVDNLIYDEDVSDDYRRNLTAHFLGRKRQLILSVLGWNTPADYEYWSLVANMKFAHDAKNMVWARSSNLIKYGVELDFGIDTGQFVYIYPFINYQILALEKNSDPDTYTDILDDGIGGETKVSVAALAMSKQFDVFDAELLKGDLHTSGDTGYEVDLTVWKNLLSGTPTISNITSGMYRFPIGTNATRFLFQLYDNTAFRCVFERLDFYFNVHGERRLS